MMTHGTAMDPLPRQLLPRSLKTLADYCGDRVMWTVWEAHGGTHLHVPAHAGPGHPLFELLGPDACRLTEAFGGETLHIPKADAARRAVRNALIRRDRSGGQPLNRIARRYGLSERQINSILDHRHDAMAQPDLFHDP